MATIPRAGREFVRWPVEGLPDGVTLELSIDNGDTWHATTREDGHVVVLVAGPDATDNPPGTLALPDRNRNHVTFRATDNPEVIIRPGGTLDLTGR